MNKDQENIKFYYTKAIEGRSMLYSNFNYWTNFFAIIVGALFVAYYTVNSDDNPYFSQIIGCLGFIATSCWLQSLKGFYHWMKSWSNIVRYYESKLNIGCKELCDSNYVYSLYMDSDYSKSPLNIIASKNISTQKIVIRFVFVVLIAWLALVGINTLSFDFSAMSAYQVFLAVIVPILAVVIWLCVFICSNVKSNVTKHYKLTKEDASNYQVSK